MTVSEKNKLVFALAMAVFLAAIESTILVLAIPTVVKDLHGFDLISHVFSVYMLTCAISIPLYGKLSDLYGRKKTFMVGITIFVVGSLLCGLSQNMTMLIVFRAFKGFGAGCIFTLSYTIAGDVFTLAERGKVQGALNMVWGVAGLIGPFIGALLLNVLSWHWIFYFTIPFGVLALYLLKTSLKETVKKEKHHIDFLGIVLLSLAMLAFLGIFILGNENGVDLNLRNIILFVVAALTTAVFFRVEKRSREPIMPLDVFTRSSIFINVIALFFTGVVIGIDVYAPIYLQNVRGYGPLVAGLIILPMSISWALVSVPLGKLIIRFGGKTMMLIGIAIALISFFPVLVFDKDTNVVFLVVVILLMGLGLGLGITTQTMLIQESVGFEKRGSAVAVNSLLRTLGQTIGISMFGAVFNSSIVKGFAQQGITEYDLGNIYDLSSYGVEVTWDQIVGVLTTAIHAVGYVFIILIVLCLALAFVMPRPPLSERSDKTNG